MSATVMTGKSEPYEPPGRGSSTIGPVVPRQPPSRLVLTTKNWSVSKALPGPIIPSHQPSPRPLLPSRSSARKPSRVLAPAGVRRESRRVRVAAERVADQDHVVPLRRQRAVGLVGDADRAQTRRPQSSVTGSGDRGSCVSTVPTEPAAASALAWSCGNHIACERCHTCGCRRSACLALSGFASGVRSFSRGRVRRRATAWAGARYHFRLALIDISNDQSMVHRRGFTMAQSSVNNGVNVDALLGAREALRSAPEAAKFKWRATCKWKNGTHSQSSVQGFYGLGAEQKHKTEFTFDADHPEIFASEDKGATPVEFVLVGPRQLPDRRRRRGGAEPRHPAALGRGQARRLDGHPGHPRHRQRRAQRLRRHQGHLRHRRRRVAEGDRGARRAVAEALGGLRHRHQPDERHRRSRTRTAGRAHRSGRRTTTSSSAPAMPGWR